MDAVLARDDSSLPPDVNLGPGLLVGIWLEMAICTLVLMARLYTRKLIVKKIAPDDWLMLVASIVGIISNILSTISVHWGTGRHQVYLSPEAAVLAFKYNVLSQVVGIVSITMARVSYAMLLLAILSPWQHALRNSMWTIISSQIVLNFAVAVYILAQCSPITKVWDQSSPGTCLSPYIQEYIMFAQGAVNSLTDLVLAILPSVIIWRLQVKFLVKLSLCLSMGLGVFAMVASVIKTVYSQGVVDINDYSYSTSWLCVWLSLEHHLIMIAANIPTLRPLISPSATSKKPTYQSYESKGLMYPTHRESYASNLDNSLQRSVAEHSGLEVDRKVGAVATEREDFGLLQSPRDGPSPLPSPSAVEGVSELSAHSSPAPTRARHISTQLRLPLSPMSPMSPGSPGSLGSPMGSAVHRPLISPRTRNEERNS